MRLTTLTGEASVGALADRLYANLTPATRTLAEAALLKANPHLAGAGGFTPGAVVRVPAVPGLTAKPGATSRDPVSDVLKDLTDSVSDYQKRLAEALSAAKKDVAEQSALLKSKDAKGAIGKAPEAEKLAASLATSLAQRTKSLSDTEKRLPAVFAAMAKDIGSLDDRGD